MFKDEYQKSMDPVVPDAAQMERLFAAMEQEEGRPVKKRVMRTGLVAALVCALLVGTAFAASPTLRDMLAAALGGFAPYSQGVEGVSATDQGIEISVENVVCDASRGIAYLAVRDLTGDRLREGAYLKRPDGAKSYDPETHTAIVAVPFESGEVPTDDGTRYKTLQELGSRKLTFKTVYPEHYTDLGDIALPEDLRATDQVLQSRTLADGECDMNIFQEGDSRTVLLPNQPPRTLPGTDLVSLSSMGWDDEGTFHIQLALADGIYSQRLDIQGDLENWMWDASDYYGNPSKNNYYYFDGGKYIDIGYQQADQYKLADILPAAINGSVYTTPPIEGNWTLTVPIEQAQPSRTVTMSEKVGTDHITVNQMTFSVLGFQLDATTAPGTMGGFYNYPAVIYLKDGATYSATKSSGGGGRGSATGPGRFDAVWDYDDAVDPQDVVGVALGYWYIPIDGETGGPGYWLDKLPE